MFLLTAQPAPPPAFALPRLVSLSYSELTRELGRSYGLSRYVRRTRLRDILTFSKASTLPNGSAEFEPVRETNWPGFKGGPDGSEKTAFTLTTTSVGDKVVAARATAGPYAMGEGAWPAAADLMAASAHMGWRPTGDFSTLSARVMMPVTLADTEGKLWTGVLRPTTRGTGAEARTYLDVEIGTRPEDEILKPDEVQILRSFGLKSAGRTVNDRFGPGAPSLPGLMSLMRVPPSSYRRVAGPAGEEDRLHFEGVAFPLRRWRGNVRRSDDGTVTFVAHEISPR